MECLVKLEKTKTGYGRIEKTAASSSSTVTSLSKTSVRKQTLADSKSKSHIPFFDKSLEDDDFAVSKVDSNLDYCIHCKKSGKLFECDGCNLSFHGKCLRNFGLKVPRDDDNEPFFCLQTNECLESFARRSH